MTDQRQAQSFIEDFAASCRTWANRFIARRDTMFHEDQWYHKEDTLRALVIECDLPYLRQMCPNLDAADPQLPFVVKHGGKVMAKFHRASDAFAFVAAIVESSPIGPFFGRDVEVTV